MIAWPDLVDHVAHFQHRVIQDALAEGIAATWERRAAAFDAARPCLDDFTGLAAPEELAAQDQRLTEIASACRARAALTRMGDPP